MPRKKSNIATANTDTFLPKFVVESSTNTRGRGTGGQTYYSELAGELENIWRGVSPYGRESAGSISADQAICLCQKAYYNIPIFRNTIDIQTEFSNSKLHFKGRNKRAVTFFDNWYKRIGGWSLAERFFREWFRSGNVFVYKYIYKMSLSELNQMARGTDKESKAEVVKLVPMRYSILNPADMRCEGAATFVNAVYSKLLNDYELARLKKPSTPEEIELFDSFPSDVKQQIKKGQKPLIPIDPKYLVAIFCGKQDYEALAIPMYYPVLFDIDLKLEFKKMEKAIARTADYMILLIKAGEAEREPALNARILSELESLFQQESVGRVLVSDYTTSAEFVLPDLKKILGPEKYQVVNEDIANGLMNIFWGEEKFANSMVKIKVFLERLQSARDAYLNGFLKPEMKLIAQEMGFNEIPEPVFDEVDLKEEVEYMKVYTRLAELGILTPEELFYAFESHSLPLPENSLISQEEFKKLKDKGLYEPLIGGQKKEEGRPDGSKAPQSTKKVSPVGASKFSLQKISDHIRSANELIENVEANFRSKNNIKRLTKSQKDLCWSISEAIVSNVPAEKWNESIDKYLEEPITDLDSECLHLATEHNVSMFLAGILKNSITTENA
jgi:hypothetical protein